MPSKAKGQDSLTLRINTKARFDEQRSKVQKITQPLTVDDFLELLLDTFEEARRLFPPLQFLTIDGNEIQIYDRVKTRVIIVRVRDSELICDDCGKKDCLYVGFAMSVDDVRTAILRGIIRKVKKYTM